MTGVELTNQLIEDIQNSIHAKNIAISRSLFKESFAKNTNNSNFKSDYSIEEGWISITCDITLPYAFSNLSQFVNTTEQLLPYKTGDKADLDDFLIQVNLNKDKIASKFQQIKENENLVLINGPHQQTLFSLLEEKLDDIHSEALTLQNCYKIISVNKKK